MKKNIFLSFLLLISSLINANNSHYYNEPIEIKGTVKYESVIDSLSEKNIKINLLHLDEKINVLINEKDPDKEFLDEQKDVSVLTLTGKKPKNNTCVIAFGELHYSESGQTPTPVYFSVESYKPCKK